MFILLRIIFNFTIRIIIILLSDEEIMFYFHTWWKFNNLCLPSHITLLVSSLSFTGMCLCMIWNDVDNIFSLCFDRSKLQFFLFCISIFWFIWIHFYRSFCIINTGQSIVENWKFVEDNDWFWKKWQHNWKRHWDRITFYKINKSNCVRWFVLLFIHVFWFDH